MLGPKQDSSKMQGDAKHVYISIIYMEKLVHKPTCTPSFRVLNFAKLINDFLSTANHIPTHSTADPTTCEINREHHMRINKG